MSTMTRQTPQRAEKPPTDRLLRVTPFAVRAGDPGDDEAGDGLTLDGYAAVFNRSTLIDSWEGRFWEEIAPGSMKKTFREQTPKVQFDHGTHPMIGSMPIGSVRSVAEETDPVLAPEGGAHIVARLFDNWLIEPVRDAIKAEAINGMSFRFSVVREQWRWPDGKVIRDEEELHRELFRSWFEDVPEDELLRRRLVELRVPELGPVVWPAYGDTSVSVRGQQQVVIDLGRLRAGDHDERRKLADALYMADGVARKNLDPQEQVEGMVDSAAQDAPEVTPAQGADDHASTSQPDAPEATAEAGSHPSQRRSIDVALDRIRSRVTHLPSQPPSGLS
jgi:HK97 family phage prohead protease